VFDPNDLASLRWNEARDCVEIIDQTLLPHELVWSELHSLADFCHAISAMQVRGAPLIGITAAYGLACALRTDATGNGLAAARAQLLATRPTAVNLQWALAEVAQAVTALPADERAGAALQLAHKLRQDDIDACARIGEFGSAQLQLPPGREVLNIMTHCNAGWLATIQWGTALAPIYKAVAAGVPVHVWVSETRPRNQGSHLTAWELQRAGVPCTVVADNACGLLMRQGKVDAVIVGSDRTAANGDVCNKVGTYLKALAARESNLPFYVALPAATVDWDCASGEQIPIEERDSAELLTATGRGDGGEWAQVALAAEGTRGSNPAFDVTPASLVTGLVTEYGLFDASAEGIAALAAARSS
jgi:methylthioribose-1-phosphate isomerase